MPVKDIQLTNGDKLPIRQFKLESMVAHPSIVMIAKKGSGKSWIVRAILNHFSDIPTGIIIAPTDRMNCFYGDFFPDTYIHYSYKSEIIEKLLERQETMIEKKNEKAKQGKRIDPRSFIVMDDCLAQKGSWVRDQPIQELLFNGRHYELMYILTMQFPLGITPELRCNFDYIFLLAEDFVSNQKRIYDHYAGMFPSFESFRQVFMKLTDDFGAMVIVNRGKRQSALEKIFWYKAPDLSKVKTEFGCKQFRDYHNKNYDPSWRKKSRSLDFNQFCINKKKSKGTIDVEKEEVDDGGNVIDPKKKSTQIYEKNHKPARRYPT
jgi:hypothetical protein